MGGLQCVTCKSRKVDFLSGGSSIIKNYRKVYGNTSEEGQLIFPTSKYLCLECGSVMQIMEEKVLKNYDKEKKYFI